MQCTNVVSEPSPVESEVFCSAHFCCRNSSSGSHLRAFAPLMGRHMMYAVSLNVLLPIHGLHETWVLYECVEVVSSVLLELLKNIEDSHLELVTCPRTGVQFQAKFPEPEARVD